MRSGVGQRLCRGLLSRWFWPPHVLARRPPQPTDSALCGALWGRSPCCCTLEHAAHVSHGVSGAFGRAARRMRQLQRSAMSRMLTHAPAPLATSHARGFVGLRHGSAQRMRRRGMAGGSPWSRSLGGRPAGALPCGRYLDRALRGSRTAAAGKLHPGYKARRVQPILLLLRRAQTRHFQLLLRTELDWTTGLRYEAVLAKKAS